MRAAVALALMLAGCGERGADGGNAGATANQIERLSTPKVETPDPGVSARPQPLGLADLDAAGMPDPACDFSRGGQLLLAATSSDAVARIGGHLLHLTHSSPLGSTGGFFEDRRISISVGRISQAAPMGEAGGWPARIAVTNRRTKRQSELVGVWRCGALAEEP